MKVDLMIRNAKVFNTYLKQFVLTDAAVLNGRFFYIGQADMNQLAACQEIDAHGKWLVPGLIDIHLHIESSMVTPAAFSWGLIKNGVTTVVSEPHEIANVFGLEGVEAMIQCAENTVADIFYGIPSSVPSTGFETTGGHIDLNDVKKLLDREKVVCLGEVMNYGEVVEKPDSQINNIITYIRNHYPQMAIEGHCPKVTGLALARFIYAGVDSDHTQQTVEGLKDRIMNGMFVELQDKSLTPEIIDFLNANAVAEHFCLVTDDTMADTFIREGHLNRIVRKAIRLGMKPELAIYAATYTPANRMRFFDRGAVAPGKLADFVLLDNLEQFAVAEVYKEGKKVYAKGEDYPAPRQQGLFPAKFYHSVKLPQLTPADFALQAPAGREKVTCRVIEIADRTTFTQEAFQEFPVREGWIDWEHADCCLVAVFERYGQRPGRAFGLARGDSLKRGAVATTLAHDHHNLLVIGRNLQDMITAGNAVIDSQGGYCAVDDGCIIAKVNLPVGGILSEESLEEVGDSLSRLRSALSGLGYRHFNSIMSLSTLGLPVSPELKLTDQGLIKVSVNQIVDLVLPD